MNVIETYVEQIMSGSSPDRPLWNIEKIKQGKVNGWNYIDGCMMIALLNLHKITGEKRYYDFAENFLDYYVFDDGSIRGFNEKEYNLDSICEGRVLFDVYASAARRSTARPWTCSTASSSASPAPMRAASGTRPSTPTRCGWTGFIWPRSSTPGTPLSLNRARTMRTS